MRMYVWMVSILVEKRTGRMYVGDLSTSVIPFEIELVQRIGSYRFHLRVAVATSIRMSHSIINKNMGRRKYLNSPC